MINKVLYVSRGGNTEKLAQAIAKGIGNKAERIGNGTKIENMGLLFIGGSIYAGKIDDTLKNFLTSIEKGQVKEVVVFSTSFMKKTALEDVKSFLTPKNIKVSDNEFYCKGSFLFMNRGRPNDKDLAEAEQFAKKALTAFNKSK